MSNQPVQTVSTAGDRVKVTLALCAVVAGVVGFFLLAGKPAIMRIGALVGGLLVAVAIAWTSIAGQAFLNYARESVREARKVVWPTRKEALQMTGVVFAFVVIMALFLWGVDKLVGYVLYNLILGWRS